MQGFGVEDRMAQAWPVTEHSIYHQGCVRLRVQNWTRVDQGHSHFVNCIAKVSATIGEKSTKMSAFLWWNDLLATQYDRVRLRRPR